MSETNLKARSEASRQKLKSTVLVRFQFFFLIIKGEVIRNKTAFLEFF